MLNSLMGLLSCDMIRCMHALRFYRGPLDGHPSCTRSPQVRYRAYGTMVQSAGSWWWRPVERCCNVFVDELVRKIHWKDEQEKKRTNITLTLWSSFMVGPTLPAAGSLHSVHHTIIPADIRLAVGRGATITLPHSAYKHKHRTTNLFWRSSWYTCCYMFSVQRNIQHPR